MGQAVFRPLVPLSLLIVLFYNNGEPTPLQKYRNAIPLRVGFWRLQRRPR